MQPAARDLGVTAHSKVSGHLVQLGAVPVVRLARLLDRALPVAIAGLVLVEVVLTLEGAVVVQAPALLGAAVPVVSLELLEDGGWPLLHTLLGAAGELAHIVVLAVLVLLLVLVEAQGVLLVDLEVVLLVGTGVAGLLLVDRAGAGRVPVVRGVSRVSQFGRGLGAGGGVVAVVLLLAPHALAAVVLVVPVVPAPLAPAGLGDHHLVSVMGGGGRGRGVSAGGGVVAAVLLLAPHALAA